MFLASKVPNPKEWCFIFGKQTEAWVALVIVFSLATSLVAFATEPDGDKVSPKLSGETTTTVSTPSYVTKTDVEETLAVSGDFCAKVIADDLYRKGIDTTEELKGAPVNGLPFEILKERIRDKEALAKKRAAARERVRNSNQTRVSGGRSGSDGRWSTVRYGKGTERWRPYVKKCLASRPDLVPVAMRIINGESHGNPGSIGGGGGMYYGICQFGPGWVGWNLSGTKPVKANALPKKDWGTPRDWRMDPYRAIARMCRSISNGGISHWAATAY